MILCGLVRCEGHLAGLSRGGKGCPIGLALAQTCQLREGRPGFHSENTSQGSKETICLGFWVLISTLPILTCLGAPSLLGR